MNQRAEHPRVSRSLAEQAYLALEEQVVTLELPPGSLVQEKQLVDGLGIGRTPVREAVQRLAGHGLFRIMPRKGLMVTPVLKSELHEVLETRRVLERLLVVKAAERADSEQRDELDHLAADIDRSANDLPGFLRLDRRLDELLESACDNPYLVKAMAPLHTHCRRLWFLKHRQPDVHDSAGLHAGLARAVSANDGSGAIRALNGIISGMEHLIGGLDAIS